MRLPRRLALALTAAAAVAAARTQPPSPAPQPSPTTVAGVPVNYDESKVNQASLPDPLVLNDGTKIRDRETWFAKRRPEILRSFEEHQFGKSPPAPKKVVFRTFDKGTPALGGKAIRKQTTIYFGADETSPSMDLLVYLPQQAANAKPAPLLLNLSFAANSNQVDDPGIKQGEVWSRDKQRVAASTAKPNRLDISRFLDKGIGFATVYYGDIDPDFEGGIQQGVRRLFTKAGAEADRGPDEWGSIAAWAWGVSRAIDYLETERAVDAKRIALVGISRLGKTALWAGAADTRIAMVIESCSGEGGASLSRRDYGETVKHLGVRFPYWFARNYLKHGDDPRTLPVDAHMLMALIAPRPLLLQTGDTDHWADPKGEFLAGVAATPVYALLGKQGLAGDWPPAGKPILNTLGYSMHAGGHGTIPSDWDLFAEFMQRQLVEGRK
jgi:hypothetical protein